MKHTKFIALMLTVLLMLTMFPASLAFAENTDEDFLVRENSDVKVVNSVLHVGGSVKIKPTYEQEEYYFEFTPIKSGWYVIYSQGCRGACEIFDPEDRFHYIGMSGEPTDFVEKKYLKEGITYGFKLFSFSEDEYTVYFDKCVKAEKIAFSDDCIDEIQAGVPVVYGYEDTYDDLYYEFFPLTAYEESVTWSSSNKKIATADEEGRVTFISPGTAIITVKSENGLTAKCKVIVLEAKALALNSLEKFDLSESIVGYERFVFTPETNGVYSFSVQKRHANEDAPGRVIVDLYEKSEDGLTFIDLYGSYDDSKTFFLNLQADKEYLFSIRFQDISESEEKDIPKVSIYMQKGKNEYVFAKPGDVDGNEVVNAADARFALRAAVGLETFSDVVKSYADVNHDGKITSADARLILRCAVGLEIL